MSINAVLIIIVLISLFPVIVVTSLHGKYFKQVLLLSFLNILIAAIAFVPVNRNHSGIYALISLFNVIFGIVLWHLSFKRNYLEADPAKINKQALENNHEGLRKFYMASGGLLALGIIGFVVLIIIIFMVGLSQI